MWTSSRAGLSKYSPQKMWSSGVAVMCNGRVPRSTRCEKREILFLPGARVTIAPGTAATIVSGGKDGEGMKTVAEQTEGQPRLQ